MGLQHIEPQIIADRMEEVSQETFGHLAPKKNTSYEGFIVFCWASDGTLCPIDYDFKKLPGSPWLYDAIVDFIGDNAKKQGRIYRFDGVFCNYKFIGKVTEIKYERHIQTQSRQ